MSHRVKAALVACCLLVPLAGTGQVDAQVFEPRQDLDSLEWSFVPGHDPAYQTGGGSGWAPIDIGQGWGGQGYEGHYGQAWYKADLQIDPSIVASPRVQLRLGSGYNSVGWAYLDGELIGAVLHDERTLDLPHDKLDPDGNLLTVRIQCDGPEGLIGYDPCGLVEDTYIEGGSTSRSEVPMNVGSDALGNIAEPGTPLELTATVLNSTTETRTFSVRFQAVHDDGGPAALDETVPPETLQPGDVHVFTTLFSSERRGLYALTATLSDEDGSIRTQDLQFGVADSPGPPDTRFGINAVNAFDVAAFAPTGGLTHYDLAVRAGATSMREHLIGWKSVQQEPDLWNWSTYDFLVSEADRTGVEILWNILGTPYWALNAPVPNLATAFLASFQYPPFPNHYDSNAQFHAAAATRYPGSLWEIGNEPDSPIPNRYLTVEYGAEAPRAYMEQLKAAKEAIKAADNTATVVLAGLQAPDGRQFPSEIVGPTWFDRFVEAGGMEHFDVMNFHAYAGNSPGNTGRPEELALRCSDNQEQLAELGYAGMPLWNSETNYNVPDTESSRRAATRNYVESLVGGCDRIWFFHIADYASEPFEFGLFTVDAQPRPAFFTHLTTTRLLSGLDQITDLRPAEEGPAFSFTDGTRTATVMWDDDEGGRTVTVPAGTTPLDDVGNPLDHDGTVEVGPRAVWFVAG